MINENVSDSAAATQQQHLVLHRALVYIQWIGGGPVVEHTYSLQSWRKLLEFEGLGEDFEAVSLIPSPPTMVSEVEKVPKFYYCLYWISETDDC